MTLPEISLSHVIQPYLTGHAELQTPCQLLWFGPSTPILVQHNHTDINPPIGITCLSHQLL